MARPVNDLPVRFSRTRKGKLYWFARWRGAEITLGPDGSERAASAWRNLLHRTADDPDGVALRRDAILLTELFAAFFASDESPQAASSREELTTALACLTNAKPLTYPGGPDYTDLEAAALRPAEFKAWRRWLAGLRLPSGVQRLGAARVQKLSYAVTRCYSWGVTQGLVADGVVEPLERVLAVAVPGAKRPRVVGQVDAGRVAAVLPFLRPPVRAIVRLQQITGARPGELAAMRPCDVHRGGVVKVPHAGVHDLNALGIWLYVPATHKNAGRGKPRYVPLAGIACEVLRPFLDRPAEAYCFDPREAIDDLRREQRAGRIGGGNRKTAAADPKRKPGVRYTPSALRVAVARACVAAGVEVFTPYQIRHLAANEIDGDGGLDDVQAALGHSSPDTSRRYAKRNFARAVDVAKRRGEPSGNPG